MNISRTSEETPKVVIQHKVADIRGGVAVKTSNLTAAVLPEATPLALGNDGLYVPIATAKVVEAANSTATTYAVAKGHLFVVGDKVWKNSSTNVNITAIDSSDPAKDVITVDATLGARAVDGVLTAGGLGEAVAITGETNKIRKNANLFASAWVIAVVGKSLVNVPDYKPALVLYV